MDEPGDVIEEAPRIAPEGSASASVYQRVLGDDFAALDPRLQRYLGPIAVGSLGVGRGVYDQAGSRLAVLRPILAMMARRHVLFPEAGRDVPFTVTNASGRDGSLSATRTFAFPRRTRVMEDTMSVVGGGLVDRLGRRRGFEVGLRLSVVSGGLRMVSTRLAVRVGGRRIPLPRLATMTLDERTDSDDPTRQCVDVRVHAPLLGEIFRYTGTFAYEVVPQPASMRTSARAAVPSEEKNARSRGR